MSDAKIVPIRSETDYERTLARIDILMEAEPGSPEFDELDVLVDLVELYEGRHEPMGYPSPLAAIEFRMEQGNLRPRDLIPFIGSRAKVSEVLAGKRAITMPMARALHRHLGIPADVLLGEPGAAPGDALADLEWSRFPVKAMAKLGWIPDRSRSSESTEEIIRGLIDRAGGADIAGAALYRRNDHLRANAKADPHALKAWCWQVLALANEQRPEADYVPGTVTPKFLGKVARLSWSEDGPRLAQDFLAEHGIVLIVSRHLPKTYLDGAALRLGDNRPVVGLTLRCDRVDNFWFCLLHELAHVGRHMDRNEGNAFVDDLTLRNVAGREEDPREVQADEWAEEALVPSAAWNASVARENPTPMAVMSLATKLEVHPAIIAGRVRYERRNYRLLSQFVGTGEIRRHFGMTA